MNLSLVRYFSMLVFCLSMCLSGFAQRPAAFERAGDQAMESADYYTALYHYGQALEQKVATSVQYKYAEAAREFKAYESATEAYRQVLESPAKSDYPSANYWLGWCLQQLGNYTEAIAQFEAFLTAGGNGDEVLSDEARQAIADCQWALEQQGAEDIRVERMHRRINSPYSEFGAWLSNDTLFYTSYRFEKKDDDYRPQRKISKVMLSTDGRRGRVVGRSFNADTVHTANIAISRDYQRLYFSRCRFLEGAAIQCQLCVRERDRRGRWGREFELLPATINRPGSSTTQPALLWDSVRQQEFLVFVSDRPGGAGGFDLWQVRIPRGDSTWPAPTPIDQLNTSGDELSPFFHQKSGRLFFSSDRSPSLGGLDLFSTSWQTDDDWGELNNIGAPYNSSYDDHYLFLEENEGAGYFSSNRPGGRYVDELSKTCCSDIFRFSTIPPIDTIEEIQDVPEESAPPVVAAPPAGPIMPTTLEEFLPLALYFDNDEPDRRTRRQTTRKTYTETYDAYVNRENTYYQQFEDDIEKLTRIEDFFTNEVSFGFQKLERFSDILLQQLEAGLEVEIFLKGYTSPRAQSDYNLQLGRRRISSVRNYFANWRDGVFTDFLASGQFVISELSFGETQAAASVQDERAGERASIYSAEAARERRVEIVEIKRN